MFRNCRKILGSCQILVRAATYGNPKALLRIKAKVEAKSEYTNDEASYGDTQEQRNEI